MHVDLHIMTLEAAPVDWASHLGLVCPRYREKAATKAPEPTRLGEFAAGLLLASVLGVRADEQLTLGPEGKPELSAGSPHIGLSHDDAMAVLAVADGVVGVDVEEVPAQYGSLQRDALRGVLSAERIERVERAPDPALSFALAWTRVEAGAWPAACADELRARGFSLSALALTDDALPIDDPDLDLGQWRALFFGCEGWGLTKAALAACDQALIIPMARGVDSLNVAASSAVAFWQLFQTGGRQTGGRC